MDSLRGYLLIASPKLPDANFYRTVVLIIHHDEQGAFGVVQLERRPDVDALRERFVTEGVWIRPFGDVVYLAPPFVIDTHELAALIDAVDRVLRARLG